MDLRDHGCRGGQFPATQRPEFIRGHDPRETVDRRAYQPARLSHAEHHLSPGPDPSPAAPEPPAAEPALVALVEAAPAPAPARPPISLASLAELVTDDLSPGPASLDLSPRPSSTLVGLGVPSIDGGQIDLDRVDGVANDDEERRRARLAALEARLQKADHDAPRRARLVELAHSRRPRRRRRCRCR